MRLVLDLETSSTADLRLTGAHAYAEHPETRVTVLCFAVDDGPVHTWTGGFCPPLFAAAIEQGAIVVAHNYLFEFNVYHHKLGSLGWPEIPLSQWSCTMARALVAGYPASLELASRAAKLAIPKDKSARDLMLRMARPRTTDPITWWHETSPEHFDRLCAYCVTDVEAERLLDQAVPELSPRERLVFEVDHHLNQTGLRIDEALVLRLHELAGEAKTKLTRELVRLTHGQVTSANQVAKLRDWLAGIGSPVPDLKRATVRGLLARDTVAGAARTALQARLDASRSSTAKLGAVLSARSQDGRVKGTFQYYGAHRTGRWAGRRFQPQNLFRGSIKDVPAALASIMAGATPDELDALYEDSPMGVVASCLRSVIQAPSGHKLVVVDFSQIEARVLAWLAGEHASLACFARGDDIYVETARRVGSTSRQLGKVLVLACGYGMGPTRFQETAAVFDLHLPADQCEELVWAWREANAATVQFWWDCERAVFEACCAAPGQGVSVGYLDFIRQRDALLIRLPSGRHLVYRQPSIQWNPDQRKKQFCYMGSFGGNWTQQRAWPGKLAENVTQALARDVMAEAMIALGGNVRLVATVHDELIAEATEDEAEAVYAWMCDVMCTTPLWAPGLPMSAAGFIAQRYRK
jgi:DNA polymerase